MKVYTQQTFLPQKWKQSTHATRVPTCSFSVQARGRRRTPRFPSESFTEKEREGEWFWEKPMASFLFCVALAPWERPLCSLVWGAHLLDTFHISRLENNPIKVSENYYRKSLCNRNFSSSISPIKYIFLLYKKGYVRWWSNSGFD